MITLSFPPAWLYSAAACGSRQSSFRSTLAIRRAAEAVRRSLDGCVRDLSLELIAMDLHIAVNALGEIVGKTTTKDLLDPIFSQFCIGK
jgi:tRNA modification GTPase